MTIFLKLQHEGFLQHVLHTLPKPVVLPQKQGPQDILLVYITKGTEHGFVTLEPLVAECGSLSHKF